MQSINDPHADAYIEFMNKYKKEFDKCKNRPVRGGYTLKKLKKIAEDMGIDTSVYNTRKEICNLISTVDKVKAYEYIVGKKKRDIVTLKDYVATEHAKGPKARRTLFYLSYNDIALAELFVTELIRNNLMKRICMPHFIVEHKIVKYIKLFYDEDIEDVDYEDLISQINKCSNRFVMIQIILTLGDDFSHYTIVIIDLKNKLIEHFDPVGAIETDINNRMLNMFFYDFFPGYKYIKLWKACPLLKPQRKVDEFEGMCVTYGLMYLLLRILNPDVEPDKLLKYLVEGNNEELHTRLLKFHRYIEETVKRREKEIYGKLNTIDPRWIKKVS